MKTTLYRANSRGHANHGWLDTYHTFSFAGYHDPSRVHFGALRVINDDIVLGGQGFGSHPHDNMEIITIPLYGTLEHKDSMGHVEVIKAGDIQVMSAGSGIVHSEYNSDLSKPVNLFQIWIFPNEKGVKPRYDQKNFNYINNRNQLTLLVSPDGSKESLWIHQNAWIHMGIFDINELAEYSIRPNYGLFVMIVEGSAEINGQHLELRDGISISETNEVEIKFTSDHSKILLIEVPMEF